MMTTKKLISQDGQIVYDVSAFNDLDIIKLSGQKEDEHGQGFELIEEEAQIEDNSEVLILPVVFKSFRPLSDKSINIQINTGEVTDSKFLQIRRLNTTSGILLYRSSDVFNEEDVKLIETADIDMWEKPKSQSQRLRNVLFKLWMQTDPLANTYEGDAQTKAFGDFYRTKTEQIINHYKGMLSD